LRSLLLLCVVLGPSPYEKSGVCMPLCPEATTVEHPFIVPHREGLAIRAVRMGVAAEITIYAVLGDSALPVRRRGGTLIRTILFGRS
jgi:hypothetical protein